MYIYMYLPGATSLFWHWDINTTESFQPVSGVFGVRNIGIRMVAEHKKGE